MLLEFGAELLDHSFAILEEFFLPIFISPSERSRRRVVLRSFQTWMQVDQCERVPWKAFHGFAQTLFQISAASSFSPMAFKRPYLLPKNTWLPTIQMEFQFCHIMFWGYQYRMVVENLCRAWLAILRNPIAVIGFWKLVFATTIGYAAECSQSPTKGTRGRIGEARWVFDWIKRRVDGWHKGIHHSYQSPAPQEWLSITSMCDAICISDCSLNNFQFALRWDFYFSFKTEYFVWLLDLLLDGKERAK